MEEGFQRGATWRQVAEDLQLYFRPGESFTARADLAYLYLGLQCRITDKKFKYGKPDTQIS
jgi:hypothetical protein